MWKLPSQASEHEVDLAEDPFTLKPLYGGSEARRNVEVSEQKPWGIKRGLSSNGQTGRNST